MDIQEYIQSGIIESYVLGLANPEEVAEIEALIAQYPEIRTAVDDFAGQLEQDALANAVTPPPEMKQKVMASLKEEGFATPVIPFARQKENTAPESSHDIKRWRMLAAASVILLVVSTAFNFYFYNRFDERDKAYQSLLTERNSLYADNQVYQTHLNEYRSAAEMMADPAMVMIKMNGLPQRKNSMATVFWDSRNKDVYVMPNKLPHPIQGKQYQLWALVDGKPVDAGMLDVNCQGVCKMRNIPRAQAFAITLENAGGSPTPTKTEMYVMGGV